jgi:hypothetical protein
MISEIYIKKKCKKKDCKKECPIPSWKYCSDDCSRLEKNRKALERKHNKK